MAQEDGYTVLGYSLQHPGAVKFLNVPGCATSGDPHTKDACAKYFPAGMLNDLKGKIMIACGTFCQVKGVKYSNFAGLFYKEENGVKVLKEGAASEPSDCITGTFCSLVTETFIKPTPEGGITVSHPGEHTFSVIFENGLDIEGRPFVGPWLDYLTSGEEEKLGELLHLDGKETKNNMLFPCAMDAWNQVPKGEPKCTIAGAEMQYLSGKIDITNGLKQMPRPTETKTV